MSLYPFHYGLVNARGFVSPYVLKDGRCTFCADNALNLLFPVSQIVDHIYITTDTTERVVFAKVATLTAGGCGLKYNNDDMFFSDFVAFL